jgi:hypothetical protein
MHADQHQPDSPELTGTLKQAVDEVKRQPPQPETVAKSVDRAARLGEEKVRRQRRRWIGVLAGGMAALYFLTLGLVTLREDVREKSHADDTTLAVEVTNLLPNTTELLRRDKERLAHDPDVPLAYGGYRHADVSVPGVALPGEPDGIPGAPEAPIMFPPAPPGDGRGAGGGTGVGEGAGRAFLPEELDRSPAYSRLGPGGFAGRSAPTPSGTSRLESDKGKITSDTEALARGNPSADSSPNPGGSGNVDPKKLKKLSESWGNLPEKERAESLKEITRELPPKYREAVEMYFRALSAKEGGEKKPPQVWKPQPRPTFARVYVGDGNALELVSLHVTVTVEGPRARTLVDHVFRNPHGRQLEGTFEYPLPTGASPSYFAMFLGQTRGTMPPLFSGRGDAPPLPQDALARLTPDQVVKHVSTSDWGPLQEARVVSKDKALETYEEVTRRRIDPALLEYAGGNTFRGRVFPIPPSGYNRVLIAYEEQLPFVGDQVRYRFPLPDCKLSEMQFSLSANTAECKDATFQPKEARREEGGSRLAITHTWRDEVKGGDAVFTFTPPHPEIQAISGRQSESGPLYLLTRIRPNLKVEKARPFARHAVFLLDTSLSEHPDRFDMNMKLLRNILEADADIEKFNVLTFNVGTAWVEPKGWLDNSPTGRDTVVKRLDGLVLEGATDFGAALDELATGKIQSPFVKGGAPVEVFVLSDGQITWGESDAATLVSSFEGRCAFRPRFHCYRTGIGAENLELFAALTRKGGGVYNCFTNDAITAAAKAHRSQCLQIDSVKLAGGPGASDVLIAGRQAAVYPGGDLIVAARMKDTGKTQVVVEGTFNGQKFAQEYPIEVRGDGELAPRGWGEIAVASLLALNDPKLEGLATAYCQQFGIGSRAASFLILENENDYKRFNLEEERGKTLSGDLAKFLDESWTALGKPASPREQFARFLKQVDGRTGILGKENGTHVAKLLALLKDADYELPAAPIAGALLHKQDVPPAYLAARNADPRDVSAYLTEAKWRTADGDADGAVRVLSSVIEEHPGRGDALRLVGYRLLDLKQPVQAARLFRQVQRQRPFEPHSYRDLARSLEDAGKYGLAAVQYEVVLAGTWHSRFHDSIKQVAREEYAAMMREAIRRKAVGPELADLFGERLEKLAADTRTSDLRVTISWNTDDTDIDLWVIEPDGEKCFYQRKQTKSGGELSEDMTQGYGPERYRVATAMKGTYRVVVHYYRANPNLLAGETHVNVVVTRHAGTPQETTERHTVILKKAGEEVEVCRVEN